MHLANHRSEPSDIGAMIKNAIAPMHAHAQYDLSYAWDTFLHHMQHAINTLQ